MTYSEAREILMKHWETTDGYSMQRRRINAPWTPLLVPHMTTGETRFYIKKQVLLACSGGAPYDMGRARTSNIDIKRLAAKILKHAELKK